VEIQGPSEDVIASGKLGDEVSRSRPGSADVSKMPSRVPSHLGEDSEETLVDDGGHLNGDPAKLAKIKSIDKPAKTDAMAETKAVGGVKWTVMALYLKSMGPW
jgi:hypothetical protein